MEAPNNLVILPLSSAWALADCKAPRRVEVVDTAVALSDTGASDIDDEELVPKCGAR
jgi:hypothetical protein